MKKVLTGASALLMVLSCAFWAEIGPQKENPLSVQAQTRRGQVTVRRTRRPGAIRTTARGARYVGRKTVRGTRYAGRKTWQGTRYTGRKTAQGARWTGRKTVRGAKATGRGAKKVGRVTKRAVW
jgi:hypothetical protein